MNKVIKIVSDSLEYRLITMSTDILIIWIITGSLVFAGSLGLFLNIIKVFELATWLYFKDHYKK